MSNNFSTTALGKKPGDYGSTNIPTNNQTVIRATYFDHTDLVDNNNASSEEIAQAHNFGGIVWLHVQGRVSVELLSVLAEQCNLHPLALEDVANAGQRSKVDYYDEQAFIVLRLPHIENDTLKLRQFNIFLGDRFVVTIDEGLDDITQPIRQRLGAGASARIRTSGADYLMYALVDLVIDHAFPVLDQVSETLENIIDNTFDGALQDTLESIHSSRRQLINLRRGLGPQRDTLNTLIRDHHPLIFEQTKPYLRDCYDHAIRVNETIENNRELAVSAQELYASSISNRLNDVMKVLTIISTIFIPLSFLTGLYGMNFDTSVSPFNMPELQHPLGYPILLIVLASLAVGMLWLFKRRGWF